MRYFVVLCILLLTPYMYGQNFFRQLPSKELLNKVTPEVFKGADAVIIVKEQSLKMTPDAVSYRGYELQGLAIVNTYCQIVKLFNEAAVNKYGTFEYSYWEDFGDDIPAGFTIRARVLKPDGSIKVVGEEDIKKIVSLKDDDGNTRKRKWIVKIPNLAAGDVVQVELQHNDPLSELNSGLLFYNDSDPVLFSNIYLTMPSKYSIDYVSLPADKIAPPKIEQISNNFGDGETYFWGVRNLNALPKEPYSQPFEDVAFLTGFVVREPYQEKPDSWDDFGKHYYKYHIDKGKIEEEHFDSLHLPYVPEKIDAKLVNSVYTKIKRYFKITSQRTIFHPRKISRMFSSKIISPTEAAFIFYKILEKWKGNVSSVLLRDLREGLVEQSVVTPKWFNRMGVLVTLNDERKLFDFDQSIQNNYEYPWFLSDVDMLVVNSTGSYFMKNPFQSQSSNNCISEEHTLRINDAHEIKDSLHVKYTGCFAENARYELYERDKKAVEEHFRSAFGKSLLSNVESTVINDIFENSAAEASLTGMSTMRVEDVDSFLVLRPKARVFSALRDKLLSASRKTNIFFDAPFQLKYLANVEMPEQYLLQNENPTTTVAGPENSKFVYHVNRDANRLSIMGVLTMPSRTLSVSQYVELMNFLESSAKTIEKDIIFKK